MKVQTIVPRVKRLIRPIKTYQDDFTRWLGFCNAGMLHPGNTYCFDYVIRNLSSDAPIMEIGAFCGLSTNMICYFMRKYKKKNIFYSVDAWD